MLFRSSYTFQVTGFKNSQTTSSASGYSAPTCTSSYSSTTNVSSSPVAITCSGGSADNYSFSYNSASVTIAKIATLTITAANKSVNFGNSFTNSYSTTGLSSGVISGLTYTYAGTGGTTYAASTTAPTAPGSYSITPSAVTFSTGATGNYTTITYTAGSLTISPASLVITANSPSAITYGDNTPANGYSTTGLGSGVISGLTYTYAGSGSTIYAASTTAPTAEIGRAHV